MIVKQWLQTSVTGSSGSGFHRSRDRTRQSAVQRLVERKLKEKEKEKEKERECWAAGGISQSKNTSTRTSSDYYYRCVVFNIIFLTRLLCLVIMI